MLLLPILGDHYGRELEAGRFKLEHSAGTFVLRYYEQQVPIAPRSLDQLVAKAARHLAARHRTRRCGPRSKASARLSGGSHPRGRPTGPVCANATGTKRSCGPG